MFEVGFTELLLISVIALIVLGPERLPKLVGQVGRWVGKARAMARQFREQLESEVNLDELSRTTPKSPPSGSAPQYPPADEAPPNEPSMSDSLSTAHTTAAAQSVEQAEADTAHHPTADYPYAAPESASPVSASSYHPEADVYGGTTVAEPERVTSDEEPVPMAVTDVPAVDGEAPARPHDLRV